jgi:uncharacterized protein
MINEKVKNILREAKTIAVVGASSNKYKDSNMVARFLSMKGYEIIPVNPSHPEVLGRRSYPKVSDIAKKVDIINIFRPSAECADIVEESLALFPRLIWMQKGIKDRDAYRIASSNRIMIIMDRCIKTAIQRSRIRESS